MRAEDDVVVARGDTVVDWNATLLEVIRVDRTTPLVAARALAMVHLAMYDAVNAIDRGYESYAVDVRAARGTSPEAAAAQAAFRVATALFPGQTPRFEAALEETLATVRPGRARAAGLRLGDRVGGAILALRSDDGSSATVAYTPGTDPGDWVPTPPAFANALLPHWAGVRPFGIASGSQFRPPAPPALAGAQYAAEFNEVKAIGSATSPTRTPDETAIALFWADGAGTFTPPGHWNQIAEDILVRKRTDLATSARLLALLNVAEADAVIVYWDAKFAYDRWRPVTAIRRADTDGNAATEADPSWTPLIVTPPFPTYTSGHSTFSGASSEILAAFFGDDYAFETLGEPSLGLPPRRFPSFAAAAEEAGMSRLYAGIHFASDNIQGLTDGRAVADYVLEHVARRRPRAGLDNAGGPVG